MAYLDDDRAAALLQQPAPMVAPRLLGALLTCTTGEDPGQATVTVRLTEVEAYNGADDPGSHAFRGETPRTAVMFGPALHLYCYFSYGMHVCCNVVTGPVGSASAVLLRAGEVLVGEQLARARRSTGRPLPDRDLARGPARLTKALGITLADDGADLRGPAIRLQVRARSLPRARLRQGPRVGVSGAGGDGQRYPWRFWIDSDPTVSTYRAAVRRPG